MLNLQIVDKGHPVIRGGPQIFGVFHLRAFSRLNRNFGSVSAIYPCLLAVLGWLTLPAYGQVTLSYGTLDTGLEGTGPTSMPSDRGYLALGYEVPLPAGFTLTPSFGLVSVNTASASTTTLQSPDGYAVGVWGQYDLLSYGSGNTYAQGGLTYLDYQFDDAGGPVAGNELQFALGVGADVSLNDRVSAFTNLNYVYVDGSQASANYDGSGAGLEIGIEISF